MTDLVELAGLRRVASRYLQYRATVEDRRGRAHVARSERLVSTLTLNGDCDDGQTMRRLIKRRTLAAQGEG